MIPHRSNDPTNKIRTTIDSAERDNSSNLMTSQASQLYRTLDLKYQLCTGIFSFGFKLQRSPPIVMLRRWSAQQCSLD
ncbi:unnamed protein product [Colias eurytheme]|nr:unnamed protein product [Colias eurytheme]